MGEGAAAVRLGERTALRVDVVRQGPAGPQGEKGEIGGTFSHSQTVASTAWTVNHNLGFKPSVTVLTEGGKERLAEVSHVSVNQLIVNFLTASTGSVELS